MPSLPRLAVLAAALLVPRAWAQAPVLSATATVNCAEVSHGVFDYVVTLHSSGASTVPIEMFWYAWLPGEANFLLSSPTSVQTPSGWTGTIIHEGANDGYGIKFQSSTSPVLPGQTVTFTYTSPDSPGSLQGSSVYDFGIPVLSSVIYSGNGIGTRYTFLATQVPEPSTLALAGVAAAGLTLLARQRRR